MFPLEQLTELYPELDKNFDLGYIKYLIKTDPGVYYFIPTNEIDTFIILDKNNKNARVSYITISGGQPEKPEI
jgi:hypothetical protein